jgi:hypothetical protein
MKQIKLKIEEMFDHRIIVDANKFNDLSDKIANLLKTKISVYAKSIWDLNTLKEGESRETIILALWEYQKSLLSNDWIVYLPVNNSHKKITICSRKVDIFGAPNQTVYFYDPDTRIITITDFKEAESE